MVSPRLPHYLHDLLILSCLKCPSCLGPQGHLNIGGGLHQIHILFLKAAWMQGHWTSSGWLEPNRQKCLRSCEGLQALSPALSCMPFSNNEQPWSLLLPAWPAANQASCISGISAAIVPAQRALQKTACSHLWKALWKVLFYMGSSLGHLEGASYPPLWRLRLRNTSPTRPKKEGLFLDKKEKNLLSPFLSS